jgi:4-hydroxy-tetrahydrodipicolinate reductase
VDAPSGTALKLGEALAKAREQDFAEVYRYTGDRPATRTSPEDILFSATRTGEVAGEHEVRFQSATELLTLRHEVTDRRVFAHGALQAAQWLVGRPAGLYGMSDLCVFGGTTARPSVK